MPTSGGGKPARKTPTKGPTKAAALKALGLTQEDLDTLKQLRDLQDKTEAQQQAKRETYKALLAQGEPVPSDLKAEVEASNPTTTPPDGYEFTTSSDEFLQRKQRADQDERRAMAEPEEPREVPVAAMPTNTGTPTWYVRNLRNVEVAYRLTRQNKQGEKRTTLKPRGQRGDVQRLEPGDLNDSELQTQVAYGLVEILPEGEALEIIRKQSTNAQAPHAPLAMLTNELGHHYAPDAVQVVGDDSYKVADLKPVVEGELGELQVGRGGIQREAQAPQQVRRSTAPNVVSDVAGSAQLGGVSETDMAKDALARSKSFEGPGAGVGQVAVVIEPVRRA
jgi:hypothetical protein